MSSPDHDKQVPKKRTANFANLRRQISGINLMRRSGPAYGVIRAIRGQPSFFDFEIWSDMSATAEANNPVATPEAIVISGNARFTMLTSQLIRMEWAEDGQFNDVNNFFT